MDRLEIDEVGFAFLISNLHDKRSPQSTRIMRGCAPATGLGFGIAISEMMDKMLKVYIPKDEGILRIAAVEWVALWREVTGTTLMVTCEFDAENDFIVFGSDAINGVTHEKMLNRLIPPFQFKTDGDGYALFSAVEKNRNLLFLAGGTPARFTLRGISFL